MFSVIQKARRPAQIGLTAQEQTGGYLAAQAQELRLRLCAPRFTSDTERLPRIEAQADGGEWVLVARSDPQAQRCASTQFGSLVNDLLPQIGADAFDTLFLADTTGGTSRLRRAVFRHASFPDCSGSKEFGCRLVSQAPPATRTPARCPVA